MFIPKARKNKRPTPLAEEPIENSKAPVTEETRGDFPIPITPSSENSGDISDGLKEAENIPDSFHHSDNDVLPLVIIGMVTVLSILFAFINRKR